MSLERLFYTLTNVELKTAAFYERVALDTEPGMPVVSRFFSELAAEEKMHAQQIKLLHDIFREAKEAFTETAQADALADSYLARLDKTEKEFVERFYGLDERAITALAQALESDLVEIHKTYFFQVNDDKLKQLFDNLNLADRAHLQQLNDFAARL